MAKNTQQTQIAGTESKATQGPQTRQAQGSAIRQTAAGREGALAPMTIGGQPTPFGFVRRMLEDMDRLLEDFGFGTIASYRPSALLDEWVADEWRSLPRGWMPQIEVSQEGDQLVVRADLPGVDKDDVQVILENDVLHICGERRAERREEREGFFRTERSYGRFERALTVPPGTDPSTCDARFDNGVLELRFKVPEQKPRGTRIPIQSGTEPAKQVTAGAEKPS